MYLTYLIRAFSHDSDLGSKKFSWQISEQSVISNSNIIAQIEKEVEQALVLQKYPVELAYSYDGKDQLRPLYTKKQLLTTYAKFKSLIALEIEQKITAKELLAMIDYREFMALEYPRVVNFTKDQVLFEGNPGYPGVASGKVVFTVEQLLNEANPIWALSTVTNNETKYFRHAKGLILTKSGGTSHASILARNLAIPTVFATEEIINLKNLNLEVTLDGSSGKIFTGEIESSSTDNVELLNHLKSLALNNLNCKVYTNAENKKDLEKALAAGAQGIGLCRTEHMFLSDERLQCIKSILFSENTDPDAYQKLLTFQVNDFQEIFSLVKNKTVVIRYLDAPLHEFGGEAEENPMLGFRGARMLLLKPEIIKIQTQAIYQALQNLNYNHVEDLNLVLEIPLVTSAKEIEIFKTLVEAEIKKFPNSIKPVYAAMIETPRAAIMAGQIAGLVDYLSFGTNDLTQMTFAISRDDTKTFLTNYVKMGIYQNDPFTMIDPEGVLYLIKYTIAEAKKVNPNIHISVCGEQASEFNSIKLLLEAGIDSISVSPSKVLSSIFFAARN